MLQIENDLKVLENLVENTNIKQGCWTPKNYCHVRQSITVLVPYRDRDQMLIPFLTYMHKFLQRQHREYCIFLSEQYDKGQFNRGKLFNAGFDFVLKHHPVYKKWNKKPDCFIFTDVDLLPENLRNLYGCHGYSANHLCDKFNKFRYETQFISGKSKVSSGGVVAVSTAQYVKVNGHPNRYFGWGLEDHDMSSRLRNYQQDDDLMLLIERNSDQDFMNGVISGTSLEKTESGLFRAEKYGYYTQMTHGHGSTSSKGSSPYTIHTPTGQQRLIMSKYLKEDLTKFDGLSSLKYEIIKADFKLNPAVGIGLFDIRPYKPLKQQVFINNEAIYKNNFLSNDLARSSLNGILKVRSSDYEDHEGPITTTTEKNRKDSSPEEELEHCNFVVFENVDVKNEISLVNDTLTDKRNKLIQCSNRGV